MRLNTGPRIMFKMFYRIKSPQVFVSGELTITDDVALKIPPANRQHSGYPQDFFSLHGLPTNDDVSLSKIMLALRVSQEK